MIICAYIWKHLPNGTSARCEKVFADMEHFDFMLAKWNCQQPATWVYEKAQDTPVRRATKDEVHQDHPHLRYWA